MYKLLKTRWYWPCMLSECIAVCATMLHFALEHAKLNSPTYLFLTSKGLYLLQWPSGSQQMIHFVTNENFKVTSESQFIYTLEIVTNWRPVTSGSR